MYKTIFSPEKIETIPKNKFYKIDKEFFNVLKEKEIHYVIFKSADINMVIIPENRLYIKYYNKMFNSTTKTTDITVNILGIIGKQNSVENDEAYEELLKVARGFISERETDKNIYRVSEILNGSSPLDIDIDKNAYNNQISAILDGSSSECIAILMTESQPPIYIFNLFQPLPHMDFLLGDDLSFEDF